MPIPMKRVEFGGVPMWVRPESSDRAVCEEVLGRRVYRRLRIRFDVEAGERWLDLGANVGAFAAYCDLRKAAGVVCFEPDEDCFAVLTRNVADLPDRVTNVETFQAAVTTSDRECVDFYPNRKTKGRFSPKLVYQRGSTLSYGVSREEPPVTVRNFRAAELGAYDGVKMDVEGAELAIIDGGLIPKCEKLVLEYHATRDKSRENLRRRLGVLKELFRVVSYPEELDRLAAAGGTGRTFFDRLIFCKGRR